MKAPKFVLVLIVSLAAFAGCAKKDNSFSSRYAKNAMGATAVNSDQVGQAMQNAGFNMDIINIAYQKGLPYQASTFYATILVDNQTRQVRTTHSAAGTIVSGSQDFGGRMVKVEAKCANTDCNPYYIVATAYTNNVAVLQVGYKFMSSLPTAERDTYYALSGNQITNFDGMVNALGY